MSQGYEEYASHDLISVISITMHVVSLLAFTIILLVYGIHIKHKLSQGQTMDQVDLNRKLTIILRINSVLNICCLCYLIRVILLCWVIYDTIQFEADSGGVTGHIPLVVWFFLTGWIPTVGPVSDSSTSLPSILPFVSSPSFLLHPPSSLLILIFFLRPDRVLFFYTS